MTDQSTPTISNELVFKNNGDPQDTEWAAHINMLNEWTDRGRILRQIIQYARSGPFYPADMHVDLIKQWAANFAERITPEKMDRWSAQGTMKTELDAWNRCVDLITQNVKAELGAAPKELK